MSILRNSRSFPNGLLWWSFQSVLHARFKHVQINDLSRQTFDPILWKCDISNGTPLLITPNPVTCWSIETKHKVCLTKRIKDPNPIRGGTKSIKKHVRLFEKKWRQIWNTTYNNNVWTKCKCLEIKVSLVFRRSNQKHYRQSVNIKATR